MGIEDDIKKRREAKKRYEEEDEKERTAQPGILPSNDKLVIEQLTELYDRAERLVEQVNALYTQYFAGIESKPPDQRRQQLEQLINALQLMVKPTEIYRFRFQSVYGTYIVYRNKWERGMKDLENGKIKRIVRKR